MIPLCLPQCQRERATSWTSEGAAMTPESFCPRCLRAVRPDSRGKCKTCRQPTMPIPAGTLERARAERDERDAAASPQVRPTVGRDVPQSRNEGSGVQGAAQ